MPIYFCKNCGFTFKRESKIDTCPDCGKADVRQALPSEVEKFKKNLSLRKKVES